MIALLNDLKNSFFDLSLLRDGHFVELLDDDEVSQLSDWQTEIELSIFESFFIDYVEPNYDELLERVIADIDLSIDSERERPTMFVLRKRVRDATSFITLLVDKYLELYNSIDHFNERGFRRVFYAAPLSTKITNYNCRVYYTFNTVFVDALSSIESLGTYYAKLILSSRITNVGREIDSYDGHNFDSLLAIYDQRNDDEHAIRYIQRVIKKLNSH